jgi:hypothetical protein
MKTVRLNRAANDPLTQTTNHSSHTEILRHIDYFYFLICNSCYWCATYFGINDLTSLSASPTHGLSCHICNSCNTEIMPISAADVSSRTEYGITSEMEIEFHRTNNVIERQQSTNEQHQVPVYL